MPQRLCLLMLCFFASLLGGTAQPQAVGAGALGPVRVGALPDRSYSWASIRTDTALVFRATDSLRPAQARRYWLKLAVPNRSHYTEAAQLMVLPNLDNTLFYYDEDARA